MKKQLLYEINRMKSIMGISEGLILEQPTSLIPKPLLKSIINASDDAADFVIKLFKGSGDEENDLLNKLISKNNKVDDEIIDLISSKLDNESFDLLSKILKQKNLLGSKFSSLEDAVFNTLNKLPSVPEEKINKAMSYYDSKIRKLAQLQDAPENMIKSLVNDAKEEIIKKLGTKFKTEFQSEIEKAINDSVNNIDDKILAELKRKKLGGPKLKNLIGDPTKFLYTFWTKVFRSYDYQMKKIDDLIDEIEKLGKEKTIGLTSREIYHKAKEAANRVIALKRKFDNDTVKDLTEKIFNNSKIPLDVRQKLEKNELLRKQFEQMAKNERDIIVNPAYQSYLQLLGRRLDGEEIKGVWNKWSPLLAARSIAWFVLWKDPRTAKQVAIQVASKGGWTSITSRIVTTILIQYLFIPYVYALIKSFSQGIEVQSFYAINVIRKAAGLEPIKVPPFMSKQEFWDSFFDTMPLNYKEIFGLKQEDSGKSLFRLVLESFTYTDEIYESVKGLYDKVTTENIPEEEAKKMAESEISKIEKMTGQKININDIENQIKNLNLSNLKEDKNGLLKFTILEWKDNKGNTFESKKYNKNNLNLNPTTKKWDYKDTVSNKIYQIQYLTKSNNTLDKTKLAWADEPFVPLEW
jgi:hypothetical protein